MPDIPIAEFLKSTRNWGRWGDDDDRGTLNLISDAKRVEASRLVRTGRTVSLGRPWPTPSTGSESHKFRHDMRRVDKEWGAGNAMDVLTADYHSRAMTHIDALCHAWDGDGMWNGRSPDTEVGPEGSRWAGIEAWATGIVTRGVLLDVPAHRGVPYVTLDRPVHGWELEEIVRMRQSPIRPGDAAVVYCGREAWDRENTPWAELEHWPGLDASCVRFLREHDCSAILWDMTDRRPSGHDAPIAVHSALHAHGLAIIDMALLEPLADACRAEDRWEFMIIVSPLVVNGGAGSPVNPIAIF